MPTRTVSRDLKDRIPVLFFEKGYAVHQICTVLGVKKTLVYKTLDLFTTFGTSYNPHARRGGRPRKLTGVDVQFVEALLEQSHTIYLDEIQEKLLTQRGVSVTIATVFSTLRRLHFTRKCVSVKALERNDLLRSAFMNKIADLVPDPNMMMFVDESAKDDRTSGTLERLVIERYALHSAPGICTWQAVFYPACHHVGWHHCP
ncbi:hypothetical protein R3P38DRAFT_116317 [Favolaschia claudopus]|uniref:Transposase n=1 Tax=Favolaschia claudopus TaxID=2862362 RepID=A0AAV9ZW86_9AGAR